MFVWKMRKASSADTIDNSNMSLKSFDKSFKFQRQPAMFLSPLLLRDENQIRFFLIMI